MYIYVFTVVYGLKVVLGIFTMCHAPQSFWLEGSITAWWRKCGFECHVW